MGYTKRIVKGFSWGVILNACATAISFIKIVLLSRFVFGPTEFGVFGVGILILGILELVTETGINVVLVQEDVPVHTYLDTAWVISIARGVIISVSVALLAYPVSVFFKIPNYYSFILAFSVIPLIRGFINPAITGLQKNFKFRKDAIYRFTISTIEDLSIIAIAFFTHNIFSFILGILIGVLVEVFLTFYIVRERPSIKFHTEHFKKIINRGKWVTLAQIFNYMFEHADDVVVGRILNAASLGIYQNSYTFSSLPENMISEQLGKVTFPAYVKFSDDKERLRRAFKRTFLSTLAVVGPICVFVILFSDFGVRTFLGPKWLPAISVLRILAIFGLVRALLNLSYPVFLAVRKQNYITYTTIVNIVFLGIFIVPFTKIYGIDGAAIAALIGAVCGIPVVYYFMRKAVWT